VTPDVVADFSGVRIQETGPDRVSVDGATGRRRPDTLKVSLACRDGFIGEGQISYAGAGAVARAQLAADVIVDRLTRAAIAPSEIRCDLIGLSSLHGSRLAADSMSNTISAIREDTETVASDIEHVGQGFDSLDSRLGTLKHSAGEFVAKVAA